MNQRLKKIVEHSLHKYLGVRSIKSDSGSGEFSIEVTENVLSPAGLFHGGVIYILSDVCAYAGLLSLIDDTKEAVTHDIQVSVLQSAKIG